MTGRCGANRQLALKLRGLSIVQFSLMSGIHGMTRLEILLAAGALALVFSFLRDRIATIRRRTAKKWPSTTAVVQQTCTDQVAKWYFNHYDRYVGGILYSYQVDGKFFSGQHNFEGEYSCPEAATSRTKKWLGRRIKILSPEKSWQVCFSWGPRLDVARIRRLPGILRGIV